MRAPFIRSTLFILAVQLTYAASAQAQGTWLEEEQLPQWNAPNQEIPAAPKVKEPINPKCGTQARSPQGDEDKRVRDRGWDLVTSISGDGQVRVVRGTASYDGMCRPMQYWDFVFVRGVFAGTLTPKPVDSRTDGALTRVSIESPARLSAEYSRYEKTDPLCCPSRTTRVAFEITGDPPVARASAVTPAPAGLAGTSWQLVKFEGGDDRVVAPDDGAKYTLAFDGDGQLSVRVDCNRGRGTWKSDGSSSLELGQLALTRAMCAKGSMHDQIIKHWADIRSYVIRDGHLFLSLRADGGIYEFEPIRK